MLLPERRDTVTKVLWLLPVLLPMATGLAQADGPAIDPTAQADPVAFLTAAGILDVTDDGFPGAEKITRHETAILASRLIAYAGLRVIREDDDTPLNQYILDRGIGLGAEVAEMPVPAGHAAHPAYVFLANCSPDAGEPLLDQAEGRTKLEVARATARVLRDLIEAQDRVPVAHVPAEDDPTDYDFGDEGPPEIPDVEDDHTHT